ncbi:hypothetical protein [Planomonospora alba]|uniref:hypothetical protein n=1 Tax=Planomonospora alba TaxID=161354 RepID=UPI0031E89280
MTSVAALQELEIMGGKALPRSGGAAGTAQPPGGAVPAPDVLGERIEYNLVRLLERTEALLREHRREVLCLAHALETHKTLNGDDVVAVIELRRGPLVDGSVYASDGFYAEIEEYHREAARAHREHDRVARALPVPAGALRPPPAVPPGGPDVVPAPGFAPPGSAAAGGPGIVPWRRERTEDPPEGGAPERPPERVRTARPGSGTARPGHRGPARAGGSAGRCARPERSRPAWPRWRRSHCSGRTC